MPATHADSESESSGPRHTIGALLRETRLSYGGEIDHIAGLLRIRASYLTAIEESQYAQLPGPVYAQGFVRAYAVHLGLDGDEAIRRFKQEVAGFEVSRDLRLPVPLAERSVPGGTMVLAALILALCGYGLWYYVSTSDRSHPERVSAVPPDLIAATQKPPAPDAMPPAATTPVPATAPDNSAVAPNAPAPIVAATPASPAPPSPTPSLAPPPTAAPPLAPVQAAAPAPLPAVSATLVAPPPAQIASAPPVTVAPPPTDATAAATPGSPQQPRVYGAQPDVPVRIVVRAIKDSWIQVSSGNEVLIQHTLHPGDSIRVPDQAGLSLRTGNGTGIQFEIDGKLFKPLSGTVRTVPLDANRLAANNGAPPRTDPPRADPPRAE
ncbi:MAG TPA: RodZ domain-containing protein [Stellaceae bacterium]|nr:RodZ domain-containing protein [Stellaceae bacterium]